MSEEKQPVSEHQLEVVRAARRVSRAYLDLHVGTQSQHPTTAGDVSRRQREFNNAISDLVSRVEKLTREQQQKATGMLVVPTQV